MKLIPAWALLVLLLFSQGYAADRKVIVVGGDVSYPPYEFIDSKGNPAGYNVDLVRAVAEIMGVQVQFRLADWHIIRQEFKEGKIDLLQGLSWSEGRQGEFDFTPPHSIVNHAIYARRGGQIVTKIEDLQGKEVIVHQGGIMHEYLAERKIAGRLILTGNPADSLRLLASGKHDYAVSAMVPGMYIIKKYRLTNVVPVAKSIVSQRYGFAVHKGDKELQALFAEGLAILEQTGEIEKIKEKWLGVVEQDDITIMDALRYAAVVFVPLLIALGVVVLWSQSLQRKVREKTASLTEALNELKINQESLLQADKMAALGVLVSGVAHEINNPNGQIQVTIPVLKRVVDDLRDELDAKYDSEGDFLLGGIPYSRMRGELDKMLSNMEESSTRISRIVRDLKDFARKEDSCDISISNLNTVVESALRLLEHPLKKGTNSLSVTLADDILEFRGNGNKIEQVVVNLLMNAVEALPDSSAAIHISTRKCGDAVCLSVEDEGCGISEEAMKHLTDPFFTTKRECGGTGLGLSVSSRIVQDHGGDLHFASREGQGTTVTLRLPAVIREVKQ